MLTLIIHLKSKFNMKFNMELIVGDGLTNIEKFYRDTFNKQPLDTYSKRVDSLRAETRTKKEKWRVSHELKGRGSKALEALKGD